MEDSRHIHRWSGQGRFGRSGFIHRSNRDRFPGFHEDFSTTAVSACVTVRHRQITVTHQCL